MENLYSRESERLILGNMLQSVKNCDESILRLSPDNFYDDRHSRIFETISNLRQQGKTPDIITVADELGTDLKKVGGASYISDLINHSSFLKYEEHIKIIQEKYRRRKLRSLLIEKREELEAGDDLGKIVSEIQTQSMEHIADESTLKTMGETAIETLKHLDFINKTHGITGIPTGFHEIDDHMGGFQRGELVIIAGRPGSGKSAFSFQAACNMAENNHPVLFISIEMLARQLYSRILSIKTGIHYSKIRNASMNDNEMGDIVNASSQLSKVKLYIDDSSRSYIDHIINQIRINKRKYNIDTVFIDHLQLIRTKDSKQGRNVEFDIITAELKGISKELNISVVVLSQLSRNCESREDKRPMLSDLRESGGIEQNADVVLGLYRDEYYHDTTDENRNMAEVIIMKYRDGSTGKLHMMFIGELIKFQSITKGA